MVLALLVLSQVSAVGHLDESGRITSIKVKDGAHTSVVRATDERGSTNGLAQKVKLGNVQLSAAYSRITGTGDSGSIDVTAVSKKLYPDVPQKYDVGLTIRPKGGLALGNFALWVFAWDAIETMSEPSSEKFAVKVALDRSGKITIVAAAPIFGLGYHLNGIGYIQFGEQIALVAEGVSLFNLRLWKEDSACKGSGCVSKNGNLYWDNDGTILLYDPKQRRFNPKGSPGLGYLAGAISVGVDDVFIFERGLWTTQNATYQYPGYAYPPNQFFVIPNVGLGFSAFLPKDYAGLIVSAKTLMPVAMIQRGK